MGSNIKQTNTQKLINAQRSLRDRKLKKESERVFCFFVFVCALVKMIYHPIFITVKVYIANKFLDGCGGDDRTRRFKGRVSFF